MADVNAFPDWGAISAEGVAARLPGLFEAAEAAVSAIERDDAAGRDYESLVPPLDDATRELWREWGVVHHMLGVMNSSAWRRTEETFRERAVAFALRVSQSGILYAKAKRARAALAPRPAGEPDAKARILDRMIADAELAGVALEGRERERFNEIQAALARLYSDFGNAVIDATAAFKFEKDGRTYAIDDASYTETMRECEDREVREVLCKARATRAPDNEARIAEILKLRKEAAALLGFEDFAAKSLAVKCAPGKDAVMDLIRRLDEATAAPAAAEAEELASVQDPAAGPVMPWDVSFLAEKLKKEKYSYSESELKKHFELSAVLDGLFRIVRFLFGVEVAERTGDSKPSVWHPDVRFYDIIEDGRTVANFYLDPYARPGLKRGGAWMNELRNRNDRTGAKPLALAVLNVKPPDAAGKTYLAMREVETVFHEFGHALQCMLTRVGEEDAAGINLVEWDAVEIASQFMENWCLDGRTGIAVPGGLKAKVKAAKNFRAATACRRQLSFAATDMLLHGPAVPADADAVKRETFLRFGTPMVEGDAFLRSFTHIFGGEGYAAGYYSYKWSEVMSADCYGAFEEAGLDDDEAVRETGRRYRETVLALGGSLGALDVFRRFRGRDPQIDALLRCTGCL
ncbi:MAG: M3 family metallopeptidase [Kiritimatiellae bacterium]|nr:M3 family metallopeptidase [Kiritimatiellia bacterium]